MKKNRRRPYDQFSESGIFSCGCRGTKLYKSCQTALHFPAVPEQPYFQPGKEFDIALFHRTTPLTFNLCRAGSGKGPERSWNCGEETYHEIADIKDFSKGKLIIGMSHTRGRKILPEILPLYKEQFPNIDLQLIEGNSSELDAGLLHGEIDLIIGMLPFKVENIETVPLCDEEILLAVPNKVLEHAYPGQVEKIKEQLSTNADLRLFAELSISPNQSRQPGAHSGR